MKIANLMTAHPITCAAATNVAAAAELMLKGDCGILPVVDGGRLRGVVTDRDLFIAVATRDCKPSALTVGDVMHGPLFTCAPEDDAATVLSIMKEHSVRRVPVLGFGDTVIGIVSMNDLVLAVGAKGHIPAPAVIGALQAICGHHHPAPRLAAA